MDPDAHPPTLLELGVYVLSLTGKAARTRLAERLAARDLSLAAMAVLAALDDFGPLSQRELARHVRADPADIVGLLEALERRRWVTRRRDPADARRRLAAINAAGRRGLAGCVADAEAVEAEVLAPLTERQRATMRASAARAIRTL